MQNRKWILRILFFAVLIICLFFGYNEFLDIRNSQASALNALNEIGGDNNEGENGNGSQDVKLVAVGDIMFSRGVDYRMAKKGNDYPFLKIKDYFNEGDIVFANLESPIFPGKIMPISGTAFWARPGLEKSLKENGFNVLSLSNNHMGNQGVIGVEYTLNSLKGVGILASGAGRDIEEAATPQVIVKKGLRFAFLSYTDGSIIPESYEASSNSAGVLYMDEARLKNDIASAKKVSDFVIISMHAGNEYVYRPVQKQISFAQKAIDDGADLIIGHHPHQIQDVEKYKGKYIFYSLGNFVFDQEWSIETRQGLIAEIYFNKSGVVDFNLTPVLISDYCQPDILNDSDAAKVFKNIERP